MATNHTTNYQLNLWEPGDAFVREEFNENNAKIDAALKAETDARTSAVTALAQTVAGKADTAAVNTLIPVIGTYTGTGAVQNAPQTVTLGFRPRLLIIVGGGHFGLAVTAGETSVTLSTYYYNTYRYQTDDHLTLTDNGFTVWENYGSSGECVGICRSDITYAYFALR